MKYSFLLGLGANTFGTAFGILIARVVWAAATGEIH